MREEMLDDMPGEFPRTDDRYMTRSHRHAYLVGGDSGEMVFNRLLHYDMESGSRKVWGEDRYLMGEPILAPRSGTASPWNSTYQVSGS